MLCAVDEIHIEKGAVIQQTVTITVHSAPTDHCRPMVGLCESVKMLVRDSAVAADKINRIAADGISPRCRLRKLRLLGAVFVDSVEILVVQPVAGKIGEVVNAFVVKGYVRDSYSGILAAVDDALACTPVCG